MSSLGQVTKSFKGFVACQSGRLSILQAIDNDALSSKLTAHMRHDLPARIAQRDAVFNARAVNPSGSTCQ
jgi:hypothetical protein